MHFTFMHIADVHLGYQQYGLAERADDFYDAFRWTIDEAIRLRVDFVLLAGDLFHKRAIGALTLNQAFKLLERLRQAGIPCIAVEGNHELAYYDEPIGWLHFLALQGLLVLLTPETAEGVMQLAPVNNRRGSWFDVLPGVRVHGLKYFGAGAAAAIRQYAAALANLETQRPADEEAPVYRIFMAHTGVQGVLDNDHGSPTPYEWRALDAHCDYIALGHIHKPFDFEDRIYNPGSLESNSVAEYEWSGRGYLLVTVDTAPADRAPEQTAPLHRVRRVETPKRPFVRVLVKVDRSPSQSALLDTCAATMARLQREQTLPQTGKQPIVELLLTGNLPFDASALDLRALADVARQHFDALHVLVKNATDKFQVRSEDDDSPLARPQLEQAVMTAIFAADARFAAQPDAWAAATVQVKNLAAAKAPPAAVLDEIDATIQRIES